MLPKIDEILFWLIQLMVLVLDPDFGLSKEVFAESASRNNQEHVRFMSLLIKTENSYSWDKVIIVCDPSIMYLIL
mgnify:CR=1 FL=1|jgi:hypothetical protein